MHYVIYQDYDYTVMAMFSFDKSGWGIDWLSGEKIQSKNLPDNIYINIEKLFTKNNGELINITNTIDKYPDYFEINNTPIVNKNILNELNNNNISGFDFYPVTLKYKNKNISDYYCLNITNLVSCLDKNKSKCTFFKEKIFRILELHLDEKKIPDLDIFRLHENKLIKIISQKTKNILEGFKGLSINKANSWSDKALF